MKEVLKHYKIKMDVLSPIYIGNGQKIRKKEYIYQGKKQRIIVPDIERMYMDLKRKHREEYIQFMMGKEKDLEKWLITRNYKEENWMRWKKYELNVKECQIDNKKNEILCFIKDAYGKPYIPGSSLKGAFRTALMVYEILHNTSKYDQIKEKIEREKNWEKNTKELEAETFHTLNRFPSSRENAVNSCMSSLIIGDSRPIELESLTVSPKIDYTLEGSEKRLPILRETLSPGTETSFDITILQEFPYTIEQILEALNEFQDICYQYFYSKFDRGTQEKNIIWLGGGSGFLSKTVLYPLFKEKAVKMTDKVFKENLGKKYWEHKHQKDLSRGIAPHVCKCTRYEGRLYDMGMARLTVLDS